MISGTTVSPELAATEAAAAQAQHRIGLAQLVRAPLQRRGIEPRCLGERFDLLRLVRQELVQRRIEQADGHRQAGHDLEQLDEVLTLHRQDFGERRATPVGILGQDHLAHRGQPDVVEEHVLGAAETDALGAEAARRTGVERGLRVGPDAEPAVLVGPAHQSREIARQLGIDRRDRAQHDRTVAAV